MARSRPSVTIRAAVITAAATLVAATLAMLVTLHARAPRKADLAVASFVLNESSSLFAVEPCSRPEERDSPAEICLEQRLERKVIAQSPEVMESEEDRETPERKELDRRIAADPAWFFSRLNPVFDLVVLNSGERTAILIEVRAEVIYAYPAGQGDGAGGVSAPLHPKARYRMELCYEHPCTVRIAADPPLALRSNDPLRFQVELSSKIEYEYLYEVRLHLLFDGGARLATPVVRVVM